MDIAQWVSSVIALAAAGIAVWQAWEARAARRASERASAEAAAEAARSTLAAERSATAHEESARHAEDSADAAGKAADAQERISAYIESLDNQRRRRVTLTWGKDSLFVVSNDTGGTITDVTVVGGTGTVYREGEYPAIDDGCQETFLGGAGSYTVTWSGDDGQRRTKTVYVRKGG